MTKIKINENSLSKAIYDAQNRLEVFDGNSYYLIPLKASIPKSNQHFIARAIDTGLEVVLNYRNIKK